jgi:2-polyprenyl-3-methyl-5-hydroxy-6-metoxy-1,4-benzoquinol methylase
VSAHTHLDARALLTGGASDEVVHRTVARALASRNAAGTLIDVGCGHGLLWDHVQELFSRYIGIDALHYDRFPATGLLVRTDLDGAIPIATDSADAVASLETIEHLENPRAFMRELVRIARPGGWVVVSTPNQLSALSLLTLIVKCRFSAFQDVHYPAHRTALLEIDLRRIATECGLVDIRTEYSLTGRVPLTARHFPSALSRRSPRLLSDTIVLVARKAAVR